MIKKLAWDVFKNTGDINTFMELKSIEEVEKELENENSESKWGSDS
ncbi:MAG: YqzL family protein [Clostridia bacterium]|nr:YqzL family protein [Clostridia bacterium]